MSVFKILQQAPLYYLKKIVVPCFVNQWQNFINNLNKPDLRILCSKIRERKDS